MTFRRYFPRPRLLAVVAVVAGRKARVGWCGVGRRTVVPWEMTSSSSSVLWLQYWWW